MTTTELAALLFNAGVTGVSMEATPHPDVVRLRIDAKDHPALARFVIEREPRVQLLHIWRDHCGALFMRVELGE